MLQRADGVAIHDQFRNLALRLARAGQHGGLLVDSDAPSQLLLAVSGHGASPVSRLRIVGRDAAEVVASQDLSSIVVMELDDCQDVQLDSLLLNGARGMHGLHLRG